MTTQPLHRRRRVVAAVAAAADWIPFEEPDGGPDFYPFATDAAYNLNVDSDGDAKADAVFRWPPSNCRAAGSCSPGRPTTRSSSTWRSSTCSTAAT
jgi:hypothetical protein